MDALNWIINISFGAVLAVMAFFIRRWITNTELSLSTMRDNFSEYRESNLSNMNNAIKETMVEFKVMTNDLKLVIEGLDRNVGSMEKLVSVLDANVKNQQRIFEKELAEHEVWLRDNNKTLERHSIELAEIKMRCESSTCNITRTRRK